MTHSHIIIMILITCRYSSVTTRWAALLRLAEMSRWWQLHIKKLKVPRKHSWCLQQQPGHEAVWVHGLELLEQKSDTTACLRRHWDLSEQAMFRQSSTVWFKWHCSLIFLFLVDRRGTWHALLFLVIWVTVALLTAPTSPAILLWSLSSTRFFYGQRHLAIFGTTLT